MKNIKFNYLYRDAGNYKQFGAVVFSNPAAVLLENVAAAIKSQLIDGLYFYPEKWGLPTLFTHAYDPELDVSWHEYEDIVYTSEATTSNRSIEELYERLLHESGCGPRTV